MSYCAAAGCCASYWLDIIECSAAVSVFAKFLLNGMRSFWTFCYGYCTLLSSKDEVRVVLFCPKPLLSCRPGEAPCLSPLSPLSEL